MEAGVSNHCFNEIYNRRNFARSGYDEIKVGSITYLNYFESDNGWPKFVFLNKIILNETYVTYRRFINRAEEQLSTVYRIKYMDACLACEVSVVIT